MSSLLEGNSFAVCQYAALIGEFIMKIHTHAAMQLGMNWQFTGKGQRYTTQTEALHGLSPVADAAGSEDPNGLPPVGTLWRFSFSLLFTLSCIIQVPYGA